MKQKNYVPPMLGNDLRHCASIISALLKDQMEAMETPVRNFLVKSIKQDDQELLNSKKAQIDMPYIPQRDPQGIAAAMRKHLQGKAAVPLAD